MRARDALAKAVDRLDESGAASAEHDAAVLLAYLLGVPRTRLGSAGDLDAAQQSRFEDLVVRRSRHEPLQHITGTASFRHVEVAVGPGVFVPRPETELVAGWAVDLLRAIDHPVVVDLCTGSGALALSLATEAPNSVVHAAEMSHQAFDYAAHNLAGTAVDLRLGDIAEALADLYGTVDVVVANPPYVPLDAFESVTVEARDYDPPSALWAGEDGLDMIRVVEGVASRLLKPGGRVGCEHADDQGRSAPAAFTATGAWTDVRDHRDLAGRPRFVTARRVCHD